MQEHYTWVDSLKGIAICGVVFIHSGGSHLPSVLGKIGNAGARGVQMFFIVSAFLAVISIQRYLNNNSDKLDIRQAGKWILKKLLRIIPIYYFFLFLYLLLGEISGGVSMFNLISHLLFINGLNPYYINSIIGVEWYLADLVILYAITPFLYKKINSFSKSIWMLLVSIGISCLFSLICSNLPFISGSYELSTFFGMFSFMIQFPIMLLGLLLFYLKQKDFMIKIVGNKCLSYAILFSAFYLIMCQVIEPKSLGGNFLGISNIFIFSIGFSGIILSQMIYRCPLIDNNFFRTLGKYSYGIFLSHMLLIKYWEKYITIGSMNSTINLIIKYIAIMCISWIVAVAVNKTIEKPCAKVILHVRKYSKL